MHRALRLSKKSKNALVREHPEAPLCKGSWHEVTEGL